MSEAETQDVVIVGGGVIGLSIAWALAREGVACTVLDRRELGREASWAGAGLIPPVSEAPRADSALSPIVKLRARSALLHSKWSNILREETGIDNGYRRCGGVDVAWTEEEAQSLRAAAGRWRAEGIVHECLAEADLPCVEPALNPRTRLAYFLPDRAQIRNPWHLRALMAAAARHGARLEPWREVVGLEVRNERVQAVHTCRGTISCGGLIMAAGPWSGQLLSAAEVHAPTPPWKGQILLLRHDRPLMRRVVEHGHNYLVPREDGRVLVGATEEDAGFDTRPTAVALRDLLDEALKLCPGLAHAAVEATWAGLRPGSIDSKPYIGFAPGLRNLIVATGHKRAGLQLSPATAELVAALVAGREPELDLSPFRIDRQPDPAADVFRS